MRQPPLMATIFTLAAIVILCALGTWQVQRLHWKQELLSQLDRAYADENPPALKYDDIIRLAGGRDDFTAAQLKGRFSGREILLGIRTWRGRPGYHALAALQMPGGAVLVNRGWVPLDAKELRPPAGNITVRGILRRPGHDNPFVPQNDPAAGKWYRWELPQMAKAMGVRDVAPFVLYVHDEGDEDANVPVTAALRWDMPNNHFGYALFWFGMAGVLAVIFYLRFIKA